MKKQVKKLSLSKETLRALTHTSLAKAIAGNLPPATQYVTTCTGSAMCEPTSDWSVDVCTNGC